MQCQLRWRLRCNSAVFFALYSPSVERQLCSCCNSTMVLYTFNFVPCRVAYKRKWLLPLVNLRQECGLLGSLHVQSGFLFQKSFCEAHCNFLTCGGISTALLIYLPCMRSIKPLVYIADNLLNTSICDYTNAVHKCWWNPFLQLCTFL